MKSEFFFIFPTTYAAVLTQTSSGPDILKILLFYAVYIAEWRAESRRDGNWTAVSSHDTERIADEHLNNLVIKWPVFHVQICDKAAIWAVKDAEKFIGFNWKKTTTENTEHAAIDSTLLWQFLVCN